MFGRGEVRGCSLGMKADREGGSAGRANERIKDDVPTQTCKVGFLLAARVTNETWRHIRIRTRV